MKFGITACFLQFGDFGNRLCNLLFLQNIDCKLQVMKLQIHIVEFVEKKLLIAQINRLFNVIFLISKTINSPLFLQFVADPALQLVEEALGIVVTGLQLFLEPPDLFCDLISVLVDAG